mmetsp:Transcript_38794/g.44142  ORF Transcript_38794/g.44142 Transcript_38794/m.44142 type:complete len:146 (-) Transcript_38794:211-648(-)
MIQNDDYIFALDEILNQKFKITNVHFAELSRDAVDIYHKCQSNVPRARLDAELEGRVLLVALEKSSAIHDLAVLMGNQNYEMRYVEDEDAERKKSSATLVGMDTNQTFAEGYGPHLFASRSMTGLPQELCLFFDKLYGTEDVIIA